MDWEATHLLSLVLLLLASGSWEQQPEMLLQKLEGEEVFLRCDYPVQRGVRTKTWCRATSAGTCTPLVTSPSRGLEPGNPGYVIRDYPRQGYFTVTMTALRVNDSGLYWCGIYESSRINILRTIRLVVSPAAQVPPTIQGGKELSLPPALALSELQVMGIVLTCGFVLNKDLVFSVLFVLLRKARASGEPNPGEQPSHPFRC